MNYFMAIVFFGTLLVFAIVVKSNIDAIESLGVMVNEIRSTHRQE